MLQRPCFSYGHIAKFSKIKREGKATHWLMKKKVSKMRH